MSPAISATTARVSGFPRVSGDEPGHLGVTADREPFSPRERG